MGGQYNQRDPHDAEGRRRGPSCGVEFGWLRGDISAQGIDAATILNNIANQINGTNWVQNGPVVLGAAVVAPNQLVAMAAPGTDGNMVAFYRTDNNSSSSRLYFTATNWNLSGGSSDNVSWHVHIDFTAPWLEQRR